MTRLNRNQVVEILRLISCETIVIDYNQLQACRLVKNTGITV